MQGFEYEDKPAFTLKNGKHTKDDRSEPLTYLGFWMDAVTQAMKGLDVKDSRLIRVMEASQASLAESLEEQRKLHGKR